MTCEICRGDSGPYRRHADPHECLARLEGDRDRLEAERDAARAEVETVRHGRALVEDAIGDYGRTDCSTPVNIRIQNVVEAWLKAEAQNQRNLGLLEVIEQVGVERDGLKAEVERLKGDYNREALENVMLRAEVEQLNGLWECEHATTMRLGNERDALRAEVERLRDRHVTAEASYQEAQLTIGGLEAERDHYRAATLEARAELEAATTELRIVRRDTAMAEVERLKGQLSDALDCVRQTIKQSCRVARIQQDFADDLADRGGNIYEQFKDFREQFYAERAERDALRAEVERLKVDWASINGDVWSRTLGENKALRAVLEGLGVWLDHWEGEDVPAMAREIDRLCTKHGVTLGGTDAKR